MAAKPTQGLDWATDVGATVEPAGARKASGFRYNKLAPPKWFNWLFKLIDQWIAYLDDGDFEGACTFDSSVDIDGDTSVGGVLAVGDHITTPTYLAASGRVAGATGLVTAGELLYGAITAGTFVAAAKSRTKLVPLTGGPGTIGTSWARAYAGNGGLYTVADDPYELDIDLPTGAVLTKVEIFTANSAGSLTMQAKKHAINIATGATTTTNLGSSDTSSGATDFVDSGTFAETIDNATNRYAVRIDTAGGGVHEIRWMRLHFNDVGPVNT